MSLPDFDAINNVLQERVAPYLSSHDGGIKLQSISPEGEIRVAFLGACSNCPSLGDTLLNTVDAVIKEAFPEECLNVIAVNDVDDDLWALAKSILRKGK